MFFDSWSNLIAIFVTGILAYAASIFCLRIAGKRSLSKWNAFDFIVTVALGSTLATIIMSKDVTFIEGFLAFGLLIALQFIITWLSVRFDWVENLVKAEPTMLFENGGFLTDAMQNQRVPEGEIRSAIRANGVGEIEEIAAVILETDGSFSVIEKSKIGSRSALSDVSIPIRS